MCFVSPSSCVLQWLGMMHRKGSVCTFLERNIRHQWVDGHEVQAVRFPAQKPMPHSCTADILQLWHSCDFEYNSGQGQNVAASCHTALQALCQSEKEVTLFGCFPRIRRSKDLGWRILSPNRMFTTNVRNDEKCTLKTQGFQALTNLSFAGTMITRDTQLRKHRRQ